jgi:NAD+ synthetase
MLDKLVFKEIKNYRKVVKNIRQDLTAYITAHDIKSLVLGVSGGLDSAVVAALAAPVCKKLKIPLIGRSLPTETNAGCEIDRANDIGKSFCDQFNAQEIDDCFNAVWPNMSTEYPLTETLEEASKRKVARGNLKARIRMILLYNLALANKGMVLGTDNLTEYLLGFWTLHGDVGDYSPIQFLWKSEVYNLARWMCKSDNTIVNEDAAVALMDCVNAVPTDGLGITSSDMESIAGSSDVTYQTIDTALKMVLKGKRKGFPINQGVYDRIERRHHMTHYKRSNPYNISRRQLLRS